MENPPLRCFIKEQVSKNSHSLYTEVAILEARLITGEKVPLQCVFLIISGGSVLHYMTSNKYYWSLCLSRIHAPALLLILLINLGIYYIAELH